ncbi:MAG TPA: choice-of-anchor A family protein, partial [Clostridia bacterium]|nr:choice-of-anchor A family protein [Clostridia bacterium]
MDLPNHNKVLQLKDKKRRVSASIVALLFLFYSILGSGYVWAASGSTYVDFGAASDFNLFLFGDHVQSNVDSEGRVAVGGNATYSNYGVGSHLTPSTTRADLIIGGDVDITSGSNHNGNTVISTTSKVIKYTMTNANGVSGQPFRQNLIDFTAAKNELRTLSARLALYPLVNGTVKEVYGSITLEGSDPNLNVFSFNGNNIEGSGRGLSDISGINIKVPKGATILINVTGDNIGFGNYDIFQNSAAVSASEKILWNFPKATKMYNMSLSIKGSVLAPYADWSAIGNGNVEGNFIANSLKNNGGSLEAHNKLFGGSIPLNNAPVAVNDSATVPEGGSVNIAVLANDSDPDGDTLTVTNVTAPSKGGKAVINAGGRIKYTPAPDYTGTDTFTYTIRDIKG